MKFFHLNFNSFYNRSLYDQKQIRLVKRILTWDDGKIMYFKINFLFLSFLNHYEKRSIGVQISQSAHTLNISIKNVIPNKTSASFPL